MSERSVCVLDMALYKTLYTLSHCVLSCVTDCFTVRMSLRFLNVLTINEYYIQSPDLLDEFKEAVLRQGGAWKGCDGANGKEGDGRTDLNPEKKEKSAPVG